MYGHLVDHTSLSPSHTVYTAHNTHYTHTHTLHTHTHTLLTHTHYSHTHTHTHTYSHILTHTHTHTHTAALHIAALIASIQPKKVQHCYRDVRGLGTGLYHATYQDCCLHPCNNVVQFLVAYMLHHNGAYTFEKKKKKKVPIHTPPHPL